MLAFEYGHAMYVTIAQYQNDARVYFDHMVLNFLAIIAQKYGAKPTIIASLNMVMENMKHAAKTQNSMLKAT